MKKILIICGDKEHRNKLVSTIKQFGAGVFTVESFTNINDLNMVPARDVEDVKMILLSLEGPADAPWDLWVLRHRFSHVPLIVEVDADTQVRAYNMLLKGASETFTKDEDIRDVITKTIGVAEHERMRVCKKNRKQKTTKNSLSSEIVDYLRQRGMTLNDIGNSIGCSESFVSRVGKGERSFTIEHLTYLEKNLGAPLPLLLLEASHKGSADNRMQSLYEGLHQLLENSAKMRESLLGEEVDCPISFGDTDRSAKIPIRTLTHEVLSAFQNKARPISMSTFLTKAIHTHEEQIGQHLKAHDAKANQLEALEKEYLELTKRAAELGNAIRKLQK
jgi:antitoxin component HigA of HigAB toxin-antitoxin module